MSISDLLDKKEFNPLLDLIKIQGLNEEEISDPEVVLRQLNNLEFKLQLHGQNCVDGLEKTTQSIVDRLGQKSQIGEDIENLKLSNVPIECSNGLSMLRQELISLVTVDSRIRACQQMSREIEEFESRIQKVEEFIRNDDLVMLSNLVVYQLSSSMALVRDMGKGTQKDSKKDSSQQVFRQHQQNRLQRFDKLILTYVQYKQNEILSESYKFNYLEINSILHLFEIFSQEQYLAFVNTKFIKEKLVKDFEKIIVKQKQTNFVEKFYGAMTEYLKENVQFFVQVFDKLSKDKSNSFYFELFSQILKLYSDRLFSDFLALEDPEIFNDVLLSSVQKCQNIILMPSNLDHLVYSKTDHKQIQVIFKPFYDHFKTLLAKLTEQLKSKVKNNIEIIVASFQKYVDSHNNVNQNSYSRDSLTQLAVFFQKQLEKLEQSIRQSIMAMISICQGFNLMEFLNEFLIKVQLDKLINQLTFLFGQLCSKRICYQLANLRDVSSVEQNLQMTTAFQNEDINNHFQAKFQWQNVFDVMKLHSVFAHFFKNDQISVEQLKTHIKQNVELHLLKDDPNYYQSKLIFQSFLGEDYKVLLNKLLEEEMDLTISNIPSETLTGCLEMNMCKTFIMPIYREISSLQKMNFWKQQTKVSLQIQKDEEPQQTQKFNFLGVLTRPQTGVGTLQTPQASEQIRKIAEHFISFIQKLDSFFEQENTVIKMTSEEQFAQVYIQILSHFIIKVISEKYLQIPQIGGVYLQPNSATLTLDEDDQIQFLYQNQTAGTLQILQDIIYLKKTIKQFSDNSDFKIMNSILIGLGIHPLLLSQEIRQQKLKIQQQPLWYFHEDPKTILTNLETQCQEGNSQPNDDVLKKLALSHLNLISDLKEIMSYQKMKKYDFKTVIEVYNKIVWKGPSN